MKDEAALLRRYAEDGSQAAFTELVRNHIDLVYGAALRRTGGDVHLAADVTQEVFTALARNAPKLSRHPVLSAWLHTATRNAALNLMISEERRRAREQAAVSLEPPGEAAAALNWEQLRPALDAAIDELPEADRAAVVLRFLERRAFAEIGAALQISDNAARMRTDRALERLRNVLSSRGINSTAAALATVVAAQPLASAPAGLAATFASAAIATAGATTGVLTGLTLFMNTKLVTAGVSALVAFGLGIYFGHERSKVPPQPPSESLGHLRTISSLQDENQRLTATVTRLNGDVGKLQTALAASPPLSPASARSSTPGPAPSPLLIDARLLAFQQQHAILNNLFQIAGAREEFRKEYGRLPVSLDDMVGEKKYIRRVRPVDGEDYSGLQFADGQKLAVTTRDGVTATVDLATGEPEGVLVSPAVELAKELARQMEPATKKAADAYRAANRGAEPLNPQDLLPYFTTPQERADYTDYLEAVKVARVN
ncbi:MAG: sigma-70 family RNA polymerase sigma factor [Opitutaceae bacterium]